MLYIAQGFDALHSCHPEESFEVFDAIIQVPFLFILYRQQTYLPRSRL